MIERSNEDSEFARTNFLSDKYFRQNCYLLRKTGLDLQILTWNCQCNWDNPNGWKRPITVEGYLLRGFSTGYTVNTMSDGTLGKCVIHMIKCARFNEKNYWRMASVDVPPGWMSADVIPMYSSAPYETFIKSYYKSMWLIGGDIGFDCKKAPMIIGLTVEIVENYNSTRWITRLMCLWRAQPTVWIFVNCRTPWTKTTWTHIAARGFPLATPVRVSADLPIVTLKVTDWGFRSMPIWGSVKLAQSRIGM